MCTNRTAVLIVLGSMSMLVCGCGLPAGRTCDQGCSNPLQAAGKIVADDLGGLNPDDVQVLTDIAIQVTGIQIPAVTNEQAAAVVSFLSANGITTIESLQAKIEEARANPDVIVIPDDVRAVLEAIAANPEAYVGAVQQFEI